MAARTVQEFYSLDSGLLVGKRTVFPSPMGDVPVTTIFRGYKAFEGLMVPTDTRQLIPSGEVKISVDSVEFDTVKPQIFDLPKDIAKLAERRDAKQAKKDAAKKKTE